MRTGPNGMMPAHRESSTQTVTGGEFWPRNVVALHENTPMQTVFLILLRLLLVLAAAVFAASLILAFAVLFVVWSLRALWARLTGQTVAPFVMHVDPRSGFRRVYRARTGNAEPQPPAPPSPGGGHIQDVTDVKPKQPRNGP